jgi:hypothetical protein
MNYVADAWHMRGMNMYPAETLRDIVARRSAPDFDADSVVDSVMGIFEGGANEPSKPSS